MLTRYEIKKREAFEIERGIHRYSSLLLLLQGEFEYEAEGERARVGVFQPILFQKGVHFYKKALSSLEFILISGPSLQSEGGWRLEYEEKDRARIESTARHLKRAIREGADPSLIEHFAEDLLLTAKAAPKRRDSALQPIYEYIDSHLAENISLSTLSAMAHCSVQTLIQKFKADCGKTPARCIAELRILRAKELLTESDRPISEIAALCGYENVYYFSNAFKKAAGLSPLNFRHSALL